MSDYYSSNEPDQVFDESESSDNIPYVEYDITSYGADYDVEGLVRRLNRENIIIPDFQRDFVWSQSESSRFIESLLLGLPVPGIFLAREQNKEQFIVIDGQQRLKTLQFFYEGYFNPVDGATNMSVFNLVKVQKVFEGKTYETLDPRDQEKLNNSIIHSTIIRQERPQDDNTSIYHIFERLNTGGRKLSPQQIRTVAYHGSYIDMLKSLNEYREWRKIFGARNKLLKDQELILRFLAMNFGMESYKSPMKEFLNKFSKKNQNATEEFIYESSKKFKNVISYAYETFGSRAFRLGRVINAAVFDSVMIGISRMLESGGGNDRDEVRDEYEKLLKVTEYIEAVTKATANERTVEKRLKLATDAFRDVR